LGLPVAYVLTIATRFCYTIFAIN